MHLLLEQHEVVRQEMWLWRRNCFCDTCWRECFYTRFEGRNKEIYTEDTAKRCGYETICINFINPYESDRKKFLNQ